MIFVSFKHGAGAVHRAVPPLRQAPWDVPAGLRLPQLLPGSVALQICLVHHIDAVPVAQVVPGGLIGVMAGADRIDIVPAEHGHCGLHVLLTDSAAPVRAPLVSVHAVEQQTLSVEQHNPVLQLEAAEANVIGDNLCR